MISALIHDSDHPGNSNAFEIKAQTELAKRYNYQSVLENHHIATGLSIISSSEGCNILENMSLERVNQFHVIVRESILATDMSQHTDIVLLARNRPWRNAQYNSLGLQLGSTPVLGNTELDLCRVILHAADISSPVQTFIVAMKRASYLADEFNKEVNKERLLGFSPTLWMETTNPEALYKKEIRFFREMALPLWEALADTYPSLQKLVMQLRENIQCYEAKIS